MKKILIIEDDNNIRESIDDLLRMKGYKTMVAKNGEEGLMISETSTVDLVVCDIMMPELNGYGVLQIISKDITTKHIPFIFLSAKSEHKDIRKGMNLGADDYITKPFDESELFSAIESRLAKVAILKENLEIKSIADTNKPFDEPIKNLGHLKKYFNENSKIFRFGNNEPP